MAWNIRRSAIAALLGALLLPVAACDREPGGWTPVLEESSVGPLRSELAEVAARVRNASLALEPDPERSARELEAAQTSLHHLLAYYLPILEARELSYNAYRHHALGEGSRAQKELEQIESILIQIARSQDSPHLQKEMADPLQKLEDARVALETGSPNAPEALEALAIRLHFLLVKGGLVLPPTSDTR